MRKFIGRERELAALQSKFDKGGFCMSVIYGRRRIGKTMLINRFMEKQDCKVISFTAVEQSEKVLLSMMGETVLETIAPDMLGVFDFTDFDKLFTLIGKYAKNERLIFFIDEYPYLAKQCPYIQSVIQKHVDTTWKDSNLFFIICGSLIGFMKDEVLSESAPLHGRSDLELNIKSFSYKETALFVPSYSNEEKAIVYGLTGGVAKYIEQFDEALSLDENIVNQFFSPSGYFSEEQVKTVITSDRQSPGLYNSIIYAVASGKTKNNEIATLCGADDITYPLKMLTKGEILEKRMAKKPYYILSDSMLEFYFRYVNPAVGLINAGNGRIYYESRVKGKLHEFMGKVFEKMAKDYLLEKSGTQDIPLMTDISEYQSSFKGKDGNILQVELDLVGTENRDIVLLGECKFKNELFGKEELTSFLQKVRVLKAKEPKLVLFSLSGFSDHINEQATSIMLVDINRMYE